MEKEHRYLLRRWVNVTQLSWAVQLSGIKWKPPICWQNICPDWLNTSSSPSVVLRARSSLKTEENWEPREFATVICASKGRSAEPKALVTLGHARRQACTHPSTCIRATRPLIVRQRAAEVRKCSRQRRRKVSSQRFESQERLWRPFRAKGRQQQLGLLVAENYNSRVF